MLPLLVLFLVAGTPSHTSACSCMGVPPFAIAYTKSDAIFLGAVLGVEPAVLYPDHVWATIAVETAWKGSPPATVRVLTASTGAMCGFTFVPGVRYLVYAFSGEPLAANEVSTHLCWRTHQYYDGDPDLVALGATPVTLGTWGSVKIRYR